MAVTPKISDLKEINELMSLIKRLEASNQEQVARINSLRGEYQELIIRKEAEHYNAIITQKQRAAFAETVEDWARHEKELVDELGAVKQKIHSYITEGGLTDYIQDLQTQYPDAVVLAGEDVRHLAPKSSKVQNAPVGHLRLKNGTTQYIFDPSMLQQKLLDAAIVSLGK